MSLAILNNDLRLQAEELLVNLPKTVIDKAGNVIDITTNRWLLGENSKKLFLNWGYYEIKNPILEYAFKLYFIQIIKTHIAGTVHTAFHRIVSRLTKMDEWHKLDDVLVVKDIEEILYQILSTYAENLKREDKTYSFVYVRSWYTWCTEQELFGFTNDIRNKLLLIRVPCNSSGIAVLSNDKNEGPLSELEVTVLRTALLRDNGLLIDRLCLWLCLSYGCNPANLVLLRESDFIERKFEGTAESFYEIKIPRIKKYGQPYKRAEFKTRKVDKHLAQLIKQQITVNKLMHLNIKNRPLLMRKLVDKDLLSTDLEAFAYNLSTGMFYDSLKKCVRRLNVISPNTGKVFKISPRRLRYTYATTMVRQGASAVELAELLDHSSTEHVQVYYNARSSIVERLDIALAEKLAPLVSAFRGKIIDKENTGTTSNFIKYQEKADYRKIHGIGLCGAKSLCNLYPPLSCYLCEKFQPWRDAPHGKVLDDLIAERDTCISKSGENNYYVKQLDSIIYSIAQVKIHCNQAAKHYE